jgi:superfamily II DNA helicase RecQ
LEVEEENYSERSETSSKISTNTLTVRHTESSVHFKFDPTTINQINERRDSEFTYRLDLDQHNKEDDSLLAFCPIEVCERKYLRNLQQQKEKLENEACSSSSMYPGKTENTTVSNCLQIPVISVPNIMEKPPPITVDNVYVGESMTIIDTDAPVS